MRFLEEIIKIFKKKNQANFLPAKGFPKLISPTLLCYDSFKAAQKITVGQWSLTRVFLTRGMGESPQ